MFLKNVFLRFNQASTFLNYKTEKYMTEKYLSDKMLKKDNYDAKKSINIKEDKLQKLHIEFEDNSIKPIWVSQHIFATLLKVENSPYLENSDSKIKISKNFFSANLYVPNVFRYVLKKENEKFSLYYFKEKHHMELTKSGFNDMPITEREDIPSIALILESPHKDEYNDDFVPIAPAQGTTGDLIFEKLDVLLNESRFLDLFKEDMYRVIIVNPIPVQTSLYELHKIPLSDKKTKGIKTLRDNVWICLWENGNYKKDFLEVLEDTKPKIILNCCTAELTKYIRNVIPEDKKVLEIDHPSSWWNKNIKINERA